MMEFSLKGCETSKLDLMIYLLSISIFMNGGV